MLPSTIDVYMCDNTALSLPRELVQHLLRRLQVDLDLLPLVEDRAVAVRADDVLVQGALAALALGPQLVVHLLTLVHLGQLGDIDLRLLLAATRA